MHEKNTVVVAGLVLMVAVCLSLYNSIDMQTFYKQQCQMTCMDIDVDRLRTDFWDWRFLRFQFCNLGYITECRFLGFQFWNPGNITECSHRYRFEIQQSSLHLYRQNAKNVEEHFEFFSPDQDIQTFSNILEWKNSETDIFEITRSIYLQREASASDNLAFSFYHRKTRFLYYDLLDFGLRSSKHKKYNLWFMSSSSLPEKEEVRNMLILILVRYETDTKEQPNTISIGTYVFDQKRIIFTDASKYYSWISTAVNILTLVLIFYFVWNLLTSLHGFTEKFTVQRAFCPDSYNGRLAVTRPDVTTVGTGDLNIFRLYFYSAVLGGQCKNKAIGFSITFVVWFLSIIAYNDLLPELIILDKNVCILLVLICSVISLLLLPVAVIFLVCLSHTMFTRDLLDVIPFYRERYYLSCYSYEREIILWLVFISVMLIVLFYCQNLMLRKLLKKNLVHLLVWPMWPVQLFVYLTKRVKKHYASTHSLLNMIWFFVVLVLFYLGIYVVPQNAGTENYDYDFKYLLVLVYWLFFPVHFIFVTFGNSYRKPFSLAIEAVFLTMFVAYLCNFLLPRLYPSLNMLKDEDMFLYVILALSLISHILKIYREWYGIYDNFLKAVVSYIGKAYKCTENGAELQREEGDGFALVYNHTDGETCQHLEENRGGRHSNKFMIKGLLILVKSSNIYVSSDFFFQVIKIPGAPGAIKWVVTKELLTLVFLRLFPAGFIYWLCHVIYLVDLNNYNLVIKAVVTASFVNQYKELFLYRKTSVVDVNDNIAFQRQIEKFLQSYESWFFINSP